MTKPIHVMIDLETLSTSPHAAILSIGAVVFSPQGLGEEYYARINPQDAEANGEVSKETMLWWNKTDNKQARSEAFSGTESLAKALYGFTEWVATVNGESDVQNKNVYLWANGADFDLPILKFALEQVTAEYPFEFRNHRCFRTLRSLADEFDLNQFSNKFKHSAIEDARYQANVAIHLMKSRSYSKEWGGR